MNNNKEMLKSMTAGERVKHFFEYYTGRTIFIAFFLIVAVYFVFTYATKVKPDFYVLYAGEHKVEIEKNDLVEQYFEKFITDRNNDGKKIVSFINISIDSNVSQVEYNSIMQQKILVETATGKSLFYILSPKMLSEFNNTSLIANISDINISKDGISVNLKDTKLADNEIFSKFPDNYAVCLRKPFEAAGEQARKKYISDFEYSKDILNKLIK